jgi:Bacterial membrane protein YfhO
MRLTRHARSATSISILVGAVAFTFRDLLGADQIPAYRDLLIFVVPFKHFLRQRLWSGEIPLWNPYVYMGTPFLASLQSGVFYPPSTLLLLPFPFGFNFFLLAHYLIAISGFWILLRGRGVSRASAMIGALTFALGGYLVSMLSVTNGLQSSAWSPWALALWMQRVEDRPRHPGRGVALTLVLALQLLGGAPEVLLMTLLLMGGWTLYRTLRRPRLLARLALALLGTVCLAVLFTSFQTLPTFEYMSQSDRSVALSYDVASSWSLEPVSLLQLVLPHPASVENPPGASYRSLMLEATEPWMRSIYVGLAALCLVAAGVVAAPDKGFWITAILLFLLLALGKHTPVFRAAYETFPWGVGKFRFPEKFFFVVHFSAAMMAAEGAEACLRAERRALCAALAAAGTLVSLGALTLFVRFYHPALYLQSVAVLSGRFEPMTSFVPLAASLASKAERLMLVLGCFGAIVVFRRKAVIGRESFAALLVSIVAVDLASAHAGLHPSLSWRALRSQPPFVDVADLRRTRQRLFPYQTFTNPLPDEVPKPVEGLEHWALVREYPDATARGPELLWRIQLLDLPMITRVGTLGGFDGINRSSDNLLRRALRIVPRERAVRLLRVFGTGFLVGPAPLDVPGLEPLASTRATPIFGYRVRSPAPAAYLASRLTLVHSDLAAFDRMIAPDFHPGSDATVDELPAGWQDGAEAGAPGEVHVVEWREERIRLRVTAVRDAFLVLNDSYFPGWEAWVDDKPTRILRANALVRGVVAPSGTHDVEFSYRPRSFRIGSMISLLSIAGFLALSAWQIRRARLAARPTRQGVN